MILEFKDVLLRHNKSIVESRSGCDTSAQLGNNTFAVPVVAANMQSILNFEICKQFDEANWFYVFHRINGCNDVINFVGKANVEFFITSISVGVTQEWIETVQALKASNYKVDYFTVDVALSYNDNILPILRMIRYCYPNAYIILGNGATQEWVKWVESYNLVDCLKVGIGVSSACRTRQFTGFGSSTLGSLIECSAAKTKVQIMSDGGITIQDNVVCIGDIAKALVAGNADFVMSGALFSRCIDSPALKDGYYGNASKHAKKHSNHVEGELIKVESNGLTIKEMMKLIQESLRSSISYSGGLDISGMKKLTNYEIINS